MIIVVDSCVTVNAEYATSTDIAREYNLQLCACLTPSQPDNAECIYSFVDFTALVNNPCESALIESFDMIGLPTSKQVSLIDADSPLCEIAPINFETEEGIISYLDIELRNHIFDF